MHTYGKYCVYFRVNDREFIVVRIIHSARDIDAIIFEPEQ
jgi:plasmid stabilization system protein ParE